MELDLRRFHEDDYYMVDTEKEQYRKEERQDLDKRHLEERQEEDRQELEKKQSAERG